MGYTHYWRRPATIPQAAMCAIADDFGRAVLPLDDAGIKLCGGHGVDAPEITWEGVCFNGLSNCEHSSTDPCEGDCSHEAFTFPRILQPSNWQEPERGLYSDFCKTASKKYNSAVMVFLLIAKHHLCETEISTDGTDDEWDEARRFCQNILGYGNDCHVNSEGQLVNGSCETA